MVTADARVLAGAFVVSLALASAAFATDWPLAGGNAARNGLTDEVGPSHTMGWLWSGGRAAIVASQPVTEGNRVFMVRQSSFPPETTGSPIVAMDLTTGAELWAVDLPANPGDWSTWVGAASGGRVYASRSGNGASVSAKLYALDAATGGVVWVSQDVTDGSGNELVLAPNGDPVIVSFTRIWRIRASDGTTAWTANHQGAVSGDCGGAVFGGALYVADAAPGPSQVIARFDLDDGSLEYASPPMPGFTLQNHPMVGPDGSVYLSRTQGNAATDYFYAFTDTGSGFVQKWRVPAGSSAGSELAVGPDGSVYMYGVGSVIHRLDPDTGAIRNTSIPISSEGASPRIAVDAFGRVFVNNGCGASSACGRVYGFDASLHMSWALAVPYPGGGSPAIGEHGTLVICGTGSNKVTAYRTPYIYCSAKINSEGCEPWIAYQGSHPSATLGSGFTVRCIQALNQKSGLLFYGLDGPAEFPFQGGSMCVRAPIRRTPVRNSGGNPLPASDCSGEFRIDFNEYIASGAGAPELSVSGTEVSAQWWGRDPGFPQRIASQLSAAIHFTIEP